MMPNLKEAADDEVNKIIPSKCLPTEIKVTPHERQDNNPFFVHPLEIQICEPKQIQLSERPPSRDGKTNHIVGSPDMALQCRTKVRSHTGNALLQRLSGKAINSLLDDPNTITKCQSSEKISNISSQSGTPPNHQIHSSNGVDNKHNHTTASKFSMDTQKLDETSLSRRSKTSSVIGPNGVDMYVPIIGSIGAETQQIPLNKTGSSTIAHKKICCEISSNARIHQVCCIAI